MQSSLSNLSLAPLPTGEGIIGTYKTIDIDWHQLDMNRFCFFNAAIITGARAIVYPAAVVKTRLQVQSQHSLYSGTWGAFKDIMRKEGAFGLYKGFSVHLAATIPTQILGMTVYEWSKQRVGLACDHLFKDNMTSFKRDMYSNIVAGAMNSVISLAIIVPTDILTQRLMIQNSTLTGSTHRRSHQPIKTITLPSAAPPYIDFPSSPPSSLTSTLKQAYHCNSQSAFEGHAPGNQHLRARDICWRILRVESGFPGLYRGFAASFWTYVPQAGIWWSTYGYSKRILLEKSTRITLMDKPISSVLSSYQLNLLVQAVSGAVAGAVSIVASHPLDIIKTRIQTLDSTDNGRPLSMRSTLKTLLREDGLRGLGKGLGARMLNGAPSSVLMIVCYELVKKLSMKPNINSQTQ